MRLRFLAFLLVVAWSLTPLARGQNTAGQSSPKNSDAPENPQALTKVPSGVILVKGAWSSASDSVTPVPEGGSVTSDTFTDEYFEIKVGPRSTRDRRRPTADATSWRRFRRRTQPQEPRKAIS
jgi:hypothetical protein